MTVLLLYLSAPLLWSIRCYIENRQVCIFSLNAKNILLKVHNSKDNFTWQSLWWRRVKPTGTESCCSWRSQLFISWCAQAKQNLICSLFACQLDCHRGTPSDSNTDSPTTRGRPSGGLTTSQWRCPVGGSSSSWCRESARTDRQSANDSFLNHSIAFDRSLALHPWHIPYCYDSSSSPTGNDCEACKRPWSRSPSDCL